MLPTLTIGSELSDKGGEGNELVSKPREVGDEENDMES